MPASGTFSYDFAEIIDLNRLGAMVAKTVSREFRVGNPTPRMAETEVGIIQSIGLPGNGIEYFLDEMLPEYKNMTPRWLLVFLLKPLMNLPQWRAILVCRALMLWR